jgi:thiol-disulfide isomerase/thioredoxin
MPPDDASPSPRGTSRPLPRVLLLLAAALLVARVGTGVWEARHAPVPVDRVAWVDIPSAESESRRTGKPILYEFGAEWCGPCELMAREVFADADAARSIEHQFVPVRVVDRQQEDGRNVPDVQRLERMYSIEGFPTLVVAWPGQPHFESTSGYRGRDGTLAWLSRASAMARLRTTLPPADSSRVAP